jgi:HEPN domain-containing protein
MVDKTEFERWRSEAGGALEAARVQAAASLHNWACFAAEQAAQLAVKGFLHGAGRAPWGHDLVPHPRRGGLSKPSRRRHPMNRA